MKQVKSKNRNWIADETLHDSLRHPTPTLVFIKDRYCQRSLDHWPPADRDL